MWLVDNPGWGHGTSGSPHLVSQSASTVFMSHPPTITTAVFPFQQPTVMEYSYAPPAWELKLFPDATFDIKGLKPSKDQEALTILHDSRQGSGLKPFHLLPDCTTLENW
uniref:Uncharacterized protein n=1 Tax=Aegilops tauschii TaxID=37682 RepID=N1QXY4_AEGTA